MDAGYMRRHCDKKANLGYLGRLDVYEAYIYPALSTGVLAAEAEDENEYQKNTAYAHCHVAKGIKDAVVDIGNYNSRYETEQKRGRLYYDIASRAGERVSRAVYNKYSEKRCDYDGKEKLDVTAVLGEKTFYQKITADF